MQKVAGGGCLWCGCTLALNRVFSQHKIMFTKNKKDDVAIVMRWISSMLRESIIIPIWEQPTKLNSLNIQVCHIIKYLQAILGCHMSSTIPPQPNKKTSTKSLTIFSL
jgi:hypothetical protein